MWQLSVTSPLVGSNPFQPAPGRLLNFCVYLSFSIILAGEGRRKPEIDFGGRVAGKVPHFHLSGMRVPFAHGEEILLVDVPRTHVHEIEQLVSRRHPETGVGGVGWTIVSAGS